MEVIRTREELREAVTGWKTAGLSLGFVPTMGALHEGHLSLTRQSVAGNDRTIVSIFVNPAQFNEPADFASYPRNEPADLELLRPAGAQVVFIPTAEQMYGDENELSTLDLEGLDRVMEGKWRPGHFKGVVTIVDKFFELIRPDRAYFGLKDYQQLAIIRLLARKKYPEITIVPCPILREASGLAMSSRNRRLSPAEREQAAGISRVLFRLREQWKREPFDRILREALQNFEDQSLQVEYLEIADAENLLPLNGYHNRPAVACVAVRIGKVRLIDNVELPA